ncbi:hypothetical protein HPB52_024757 [Rhipicephalus sanguineus]|uniref:CCHC-type domain-containing protein n=1 Tax=Rhipicephalus sanguineus TaxID=34632 RepID=A0A9D4TDY1_RHISA|nr:hypothetical protein HPB52_024757 [Rhipicephalus sanguineus]
MAFRAPPPKAHCFCFNAPSDSTADDIIDAIEEVTGPKGLKSLQHQGGTKFCIAVTSSAAAAKLTTRGSFVLNGVAVQVAPVGPQVIAVTVFRCPLCLGDASLAAAFSQYGKVLDIFEQTFKGRQHVGNSLRVVRLEMSKPVPNFMTVQGHRVMCDYRGVTKVCSRCSQEGHVGKDCHTPRCARCEAFGHDTTGCSAPCRRCAGEHATADCLQPRSYAAAASAKPAPGRTIPVAADDETRAQTAGIQVEAEVPKPDGRTTFGRKQPTRTGAPEKDTSPSADAESQSGASQATSTASDYSGAPASHIEKEPQSPSTSSAESTPGKTPGAKPIGSQVAAGLGHRKHTVDPPNRRAAAETSSPPHDQSPSSPISRIVKQARDPSLRNPLHLLTDSLGQDDEMETGKPDLKRPHHSSETPASSRRRNSRAPRTQPGLQPQTRNGRGGTRRSSAGRYRLGAGAPGGAIGRLVIASGEYVLWRNRCRARIRRQRPRLQWPLLAQFRKTLLSYLESQLETHGEAEFLRHWSCPFLTVVNKRVRLTVAFPDLEHNLSADPRIMY